MILECKWSCSIFECELLNFIFSKLAVRVWCLLLQMALMHWGMSLVRLMSHPFRVESFPWMFPVKNKISLRFLSWSFAYFFVMFSLEIIVIKWKIKLIYFLGFPSLSVIWIVQCEYHHISNCFWEIGMIVEFFFDWELNEFWCTE